MKTQTHIQTARLAAALSLAAGLALSAPALAGADFNGDGFDDLAVSAPGESLNGFSKFGQVHVIYGSATGLSALSPLPDVFFRQGLSGVNGEMESNDRFGDSMAVGDFNQDGYDDLAIGSPNEAITTGGVSHAQAGVVNILFGSPLGLSPSADQSFTQNSGVNGEVASFNQFGFALAAGDFDHDGFADLAVGAPGQDVDGVESAGAVQVFYGFNGGLSANRNYLITQNSTNVPDQCETNDRFGAALAAADFGDDGFADLAIGVPNESLFVGKGIPNATGAGAVHVIYGSDGGNAGDDGLIHLTLEGGLMAFANEIWHQNTAGVPGAVQSGDHFGAVLAAAHIGSSSLLAIGAPTDHNATNASGSVTVLFGNIKSDHVQADFAKFIRLQDLGVADPAASDGFGSAIVAADFGRAFNQDGDGGPVGGIDLAIGAPGRKVKLPNGNIVLNTGSTYVVYRTAGGFDNAGVQLHAQGLNGVPAVPASGDRFGAALATGDFRNKGFTDLVIGAPNDSQIAPSAGCIHILNGNTGGLTPGGGVMSQNTANIDDQSEVDDFFGFSFGR